MKKSRLLGAVCACVITLLSVSANAALITANTSGCIGFDNCDDSAFLLAVTGQGGNVPLDVTINFSEDKFGNALTINEIVSGDIFSDAVTFSSKPGSFGGITTTDVRSSGGGSTEIGPVSSDDLWNGILNIDFSSPVSAVGFGTVQFGIIESISIFDINDILIGSFSGVSDSTFDYFGVVATAGEQISRIELNGDSHAIQDIQFSYATAPVPAAVWLFGSGLLGLVGMARCRIV